MKTMIFENLNLKSGQNIKVTSKSGRFIGKFNKLSFAGNRLELDNPVDYETKAKLGRFQFFFQNDVLDVEVIDDTELESHQQLTPNIVSAPSSPTSSGSSNSSASSKVSTKQLDHIQKTIQDYVYISQADSSYFNAIADISKNFVIGISAEGCHKGRVFDIDLLAISTPEKIYIFDILQLNANKTMMELTEILESESYLKVVYDARFLADNFHHKYNIKLFPVFDIFLAAAQFYPKEEVKTLKNCIKSILTIDLDMTENTFFMIRPLRKEELHKMAAKPAYNQAMYHRLIQMNFIKKFQKISDEYVTTSESFASFFEEVTTPENKKLHSILNRDSDIDGIEKIDFSCYEC